MELSSEKNLGATGIRRKTRKALRPGIGESNIGIGNTSIARPSLGVVERQRTEESSLSSIFLKRVGDLKGREPSDENRAVGQEQSPGSGGLSSRSRDLDGKSSILKKSFKEDIVDSGSKVVLEPREEGQGELNSSTSCPFLVGSGSEASYERSSEVQTTLGRSGCSLRTEGVSTHGDDFSSLKELAFDISNERMGAFGASSDIEELSKWLSRMVSRFENFGLNIQGRLERLEQDLEEDSRELGSCSSATGDIGTGDAESGENQHGEPVKMSERYLELMELKSKLLRELSNVEHEMMLEEMRIRKEESERRARVEEFKAARRMYRDDLSSLTVIICWIEDCLQKFVYPIQRRQSELKMEISREGEILRLIREEMTKIEQQERLVLEKLREIQEIKRYRGEEKELLEEQIRVSQASKSEKIKCANFKEASMISQTIQILQKEVSELEEGYSNVLHQEKEFMEKIERIRKTYQDEATRMDACKRDIFVNRRERRQQLRLGLEQLKECKFSLSDEDLSEDRSAVLSLLSEKFNSQIQSVLNFEIGLICRQDLEDERECGIAEAQNQSRQVCSPGADLHVGDLQTPSTRNLQCVPESDSSFKEEEDSPLPSGNPTSEACQESGAQDHDQSHPACQSDLAKENMSCTVRTNYINESDKEMESYLDHQNIPEKIKDVDKNYIATDTYPACIESRMDHEGQSSRREDGICGGDSGE
ncbi:hypothetical protein OJ252_2323 [Cryptosporidium canis]|uniref:Uncharacterized protein n=1 Tax=Cryptosporidium canis TaxID=195482 RepID=A0ABQ8P6J8_9CRYT|nr:hypothetical protein OJ252_2323 [Cryptosporidium canis]